MNYFQVIFSLGQEQEWRKELFKDGLLALGFDSFVDTPTGFEAYAPEKDFVKEELPSAIENSALENKQALSYEINFIKDENWNSLWEETSPSVRVGNRCLIRKSSQEREDTEYDIIINPRQSFGTANHPTTFMIIELLLEINVSGKQVMDMGCGTGVLAILSKKMGASYVEAIDVDSWAYENTLQNVKSNQVDIEVKLGSSEQISADRQFDIFIANINLNILLENIPAFDKHIKTGGDLILSGFYTDDAAELKDFCSKLNYRLIRIKDKEDWSAIILRKQ
ncbi:MAG: 50S ribosomal protein L11 methyltransferase [Bacteroidales bacterium]|nr:50S ribosomal protein L11 methyltransferase [Bacteroidales bacterium]